MMTALEREVYDKLMLLEPAARRRVILLAQQEPSGEKIPLAEWLEQAKALRERLERENRPTHPSVVDILREIRDE